MKRDYRTLIYENSNKFNEQYLAFIELMKGRYLKIYISKAKVWGEGGGFSCSLNYYNGGLEELLLKQSLNNEKIIAEITLSREQLKTLLHAYNTAKRADFDADRMLEILEKTTDDKIRKGAELTDEEFDELCSIGSKRDNHYFKKIEFDRLCGQIILPQIYLASNLN